MPSRGPFQPQPFCSPPHPALPTERLSGLSLLLRTLTGNLELYFLSFLFPTTVVLLTVDSAYLGNRSVNVSALNPWVSSSVDWLLLNKSFYFSRLSVVSSFSLPLSFCTPPALHALPGRAGSQHWHPGITQPPQNPASFPVGPPALPCSSALPGLWCQQQAGCESEVPRMVFLG